MNPFLLLLGLVGAGAISGLGGTKKEMDLKNPKSVKDDTTTPPDSTPTDTTTDPATDPAPDTTADTPTEPVSIPVSPGGSGGGDSLDGGEISHQIATGTVEIMAGRVATLAPEGEDISAMRLLSGLDHGRVTINPDGTFAVVMTMSDFVGTQSFSYEVTRTDGSTEVHETTLNVVPGVQDAGWATSDGHYMLATDENDHVIVEHGDIHTKVYVSGADSALSLADIAAIEGLSVDKITGKWLAAHGDYGQSEDMALAEDAAQALWHAVTPAWSDTSNWLLFERGYTYDEFTDVMERSVAGESALHPLYLGAWGEGEDPILTFNPLDDFLLENIVIQGLHFTGGIRSYENSNILLDDVQVSGNGTSFQSGFGITFRNSDLYDVYREEPAAGTSTEIWEQSNRSTAIFMQDIDGVLLEGLFIDHTGWADDYRWDGSTEGGQAPNMFSHDIYISTRNTDVTLRDSILMRAAAFGAHIRSGGFVEDNAFIDNNVGMSSDGGNTFGEGYIGNYTLFADNLITSAGYRRVQLAEGDFQGGIYSTGQMTTLLDTIVAHLADPNNPEEMAYKEISRDPLKHVLDPFYNDTVVWNWGGDYSTNTPGNWYNQNADGLDPDILNQTTIQNFAAQLLGDPDATITDLANYLRAEANGTMDDVVDADMILRFFQEGFGLAADLRTEATTLRFVPDELGDGVRWDNRMNWSTGDLPGTVAGDSVDLGGNQVIFNGNAAVETLDFGPGGSLGLYGGKLTAGMLDSSQGGDVTVAGSGQFWVGGHTGDALDIDILGGRFVNTGQFGGADLDAMGGQTILATGGAEYDVDAGHSLDIHDNAKVGFDGAGGGTAILDLHDGATLSFIADSDGLGEISEFRSGAFGEAPDVASGIDLGNSTLEIDLTGLSSTAGTAFTLMDADEIVGLFDSAVVGGLGARNATIVVDYQADTVTLKLAAGTGKVAIQTVGQETDVTAGEDDLWAALTADQGLMETATAAAMLPDDAEEPDPALIAA